MRVLIDCGFYAGIATKKYENRVDYVYAFEPNPEIEVPDFVQRKAVWIKNGKVDFQIGGREDSASILGTSGHDEPRIIKIACIDFSKFVADLPDDFIICSMDIEGAEFAVLDKMLKENTIDKINILDIEFHHRLMVDKTSDDARELIKRIEERGVKVKLKVEL